MEIPLATVKDRLRRSNHPIKRNFEKTENTRK